jgi:hypothetical protein
MTNGLGPRALVAVEAACRIARANAAETVTTADLAAALLASRPLSDELGVDPPPRPDDRSRRPGAPPLRPTAGVTRVLDRARAQAEQAGRVVQAADLALALLEHEPDALGLDAEAAVRRALARELADPILEPQRLPVTAEFVLSVLGETEQVVAERAARALAERDAGAGLARALEELLAEDVGVRRVLAAHVRAGWPERPPERHVALREGTVWIGEDTECDDDLVEYLTGLFSAHWSRAAGDHEPGPSAQSLDAILVWARWRAPRVVVQVADLGRFSAGELTDPELAPLPDGGLRVTRRPSPSSRHLLRDERDPPILWDVRVTAVAGLEAAPMRNFVGHIAAQADVIDLVSWDGTPHPGTGYAATFLLRSATYDQSHARASELVRGAFDAIAADLVAGFTGLSFELYPFDGDEDARRDPPGHGRLY